jgi:hypothetical protein
MKSESDNQGREQNGQNEGARRKEHRPTHSGSFDKLLRNPFRKMSTKADKPYL